ncbi:MarR family winged helix-turn-helix transcriptional regulator [Dactylosporangium darangshiense]|uniref:HTH marR-type domain-containing protein n=1 Tax=Dactylosporangium darangshiense TaxID=579108 RepID=A0ABP8DRS7_9ACTN
MDHEALAESLAAQLNGVRRVLRRQVRAGLGVPELSGSQVELLRLVESAPGIGVGAAAQQLHLAGNSVSTLVNQLTEAGLLLRERDPADRRSAQLFLTPAAQQRLTAWRAARVSLLSGALAALDPGERDTLAAAIPALAHLVEALTAPDVSAGSPSTEVGRSHPSFLGSETRRDEDDGAPIGERKNGVQSGTRGGDGDGGR